MPQLLRALLPAACAAWVAGASLPVHAGGRNPEPAVNPVRHASRSGEYVLFIDPTDIQGRAPATHVVTRGGKTVWKETKPYTLHGATVADDGTVAGFSYSHGIEGHAKDRSDRSHGVLRLVIIGPDGRDRLDHSLPRTPGRYLHADPEPLAGEVGLDPAGDIAVFDLEQRSNPSPVWAFRLGTGERIPEKEVARNMPSWTCTTLDEEPVRGTPLILSRWLRLESRGGGTVHAGSRFTLRDQEEALVWSMEVPDDFGMSGRDKLWQVWRHARRASLRLGNGAESRFDVPLVQASQRVHLEVRPDAAGGWKVEEVGRTPFQMPENDEWTEVLPEATASLRGELRIGTEAPSTSAVRDVLSFDFDDRGRVGLTRKDRGGTAFVLLGADRQLLRESLLEGLHKDEKAEGLRVTWISSERWLIYLSPWAVEAKSPAWWVHASEGEPQSIADFDCPSIEALDGTREGGFVALARRRFKNTSDSQVIAFDREARRLWIMDEDPTHPRHQFHRNGLAVASDGRIALLSRVGNTVDMLDANGKYLSTIRLEEAWGYKPRYPSWIAGDPKGGFVIEDYRGKSPAVLMGLEADVRTAFVRSSFADGRPADLRLFRVDSAGKLWGTDGSCIARVTPAGLVDEVLGSPPSPGTLETFTAACMDVKGNLYCVDARSGSVHVFDSAGKAVRVSKPDPTDFESRLVSSHVTASGDGAVSLRGGPSLDLRDPEYVLFGSSGERTGRKRVPLGEFRQDWYSQPSTGRTWVVSYRALFLLDASGKPVREIRKQPDGRWIEGTGNACVAPDGSLAVLSQPSGMLQVVNLYSAEGEPLRTIPVPRHSSHGSLAWDGRRVVLAWRDEAALMDPGGGPARRLRFDGGGIDKGADYWCFLPRHTPDELWILESKSRGIRRLGLP